MRHSVDPVLFFDSPDAPLALAGGKGMNLAALTRADFAVPPGFIVTTAAYDAFVDRNGLRARILDIAISVADDDPATLDEASRRIAALFDGGRMPDEIAASIGVAYRSLAGPSGAQPVAVRSSATAEDLPGLSFAGQQDTYLNIIGAGAVLDAVKRCWASLWTARAIGYRARNHIPAETVSLAVVVQHMIASDVSGVLFTANPLTGRRDETVIDASFGLGEAIVSGQVEPDHYVVRPRERAILDRKLGAKALAIVPDGQGGTLRIDCDANARSQQALPDARILELAGLGARIADHFGAPQDIEWALADGRLFVLQSRPITSLYPLPVATATTAAEDTRVYYCFNSVQGVIEPLTPMGADCLRIMLCGFPGLWNGRPFPLDYLLVVGGRLYADVSYVAGDPSLARIYRAALPMADPAAKQVLVQLVEGGRIPRRILFTRRRRLQFIWGFRSIIASMAAALAQPMKSRDRALDISNRNLALIVDDVRRPRSLADLLSVLQPDLISVIRRSLRRVLPLMIGGFAMLVLANRWLTRWAGAPASTAVKATRSLTGNVTTDMDLSLWGAAQSIGRDADAREALLNCPIEELATQYRLGRLPPVAQQAIGRFLDAYGMRAVAEIDLGRPRWRDDPAAILQTVASYLRIDDPERTPDAVFRRAGAESVQAEREWLGRVRGLRFGALRAWLLKFAIGRARVLIAQRETPKFQLIKVLGAVRSALLDQARALVERGQLDRAGDIFFVSLETLTRFARGGPVDLKAAAAAGRAAYDDECRRKRMPRVLLSTGEAFYEGAGAGEAGPNDLLGDAVSPGVAEGRVRVMRDPRGESFERGEVLVCPGTDPGWTPLFPLAAALVTEVGGMVTHGSVVAREYGIPAVVGVRDATTRLKTGQRVRVDGTNGRVTML